MRGSTDGRQSPAGCRRWLGPRVHAVDLKGSRWAPRFRPPAGNLLLGRVKPPAPWRVSANTAQDRSAGLRDALQLSITALHSPGPLRAGRNAPAVGFSPITPPRRRFCWRTQASTTSTTVQFCWVSENILPAFWAHSSSKPSYCTSMDTCVKITAMGAETSFHAAELSRFILKASRCVMFGERCWTTASNVFCRIHSRSWGIMYTALSRLASEMITWQLQRVKK